MIKQFKVSKRLWKYQVRGRFYVDPSENIPDGWMLVDTLDGCLVDFDTKTAAMTAARFAREYVRKWGDIDLAMFPWDLDQPLNYDYWEGREPRPWMEKWDDKYIHQAGHSTTRTAQE